MNGHSDRDGGAPEQQLREQAARADLLEHLLDQYWGMTGAMQNIGRPQLLPGELPEQLAVDIPFPQGSRLVGSVVWAQVTTIVLNCDMTRDEVLHFYEQRLLANGWTKPEMPDPMGRGGGFTRDWPDALRGTNFCFGESGPSLNVRVADTPGRPASVHLSLNTDPEQSPCSPRSRRQAARMVIGLNSPSVLPDLRPPAGATQLGGGSHGGSADTAQSEAWLSAQLDLPAVVAYYDEQLAKAGWTKVDGARNRPIGWSSWDLTFEDEKWHGTLTITQRPWAEGEYRLRLYAEVEGFGKGGGIHFVGHF